MLLKTHFKGDYNLGLYGFATDQYCFLGMHAKEDKRISGALAVPIRVSTLFQTQLAALFSAGNSHGIVLPALVSEYGSELHELKKLFRHVLLLDTPYTALGNLLLMNDHGILVSPLLKRHAKPLGDFFSLPVASTTVAGLTIIGSAAVATNNGCLAHPKLRGKEKNVIEDTLGVSVDIGTVSFGSPFVRSGIIANAHGFVVSEKCSGPELGRISEALGFV